jgi:hypothetical protein
MQDPRSRPVALLLAGTIFGIAIAHTLATLFGWYYSHEWIDIPLHIAGGGFIGMLFYHIFALRIPLLPRAGAVSFPALLIFGTGFVMLIGVGWEFYEIWADWIHADTLFDLANDAAGGLLSLLCMWLE